MTDIEKNHSLRILLAILIVFAGIIVLLPTSSQAGELRVLEGTVISKYGKPQAFIRVEIDSPEETVFTDKEGVFSVSLPAGDYSIKIIKGRRSNQFSVTIPATANESKEFRLSW